MFTGANGAIIATEKKLSSILVDETSVSSRIIEFSDLSVWM